ncbi:MAG: hypothetical protein ACYDG2_21280 [Ruminiclostridium sp.]
MDKVYENIALTDKPINNDDDEKLLSSIGGSALKMKVKVNFTYTRGMSQGIFTILNLHLFQTSSYFYKILQTGLMQLHPINGMEFVQNLNHNI